METHTLEAVNLDTRAHTVNLVSVRYIELKIIIVCLPRTYQFAVWVVNFQSFPSDIIPQIAWLFFDILPTNDL